MPNVVFFTNLAPDTAALLTSQAPAEFAVTTASAKLPPNEQVALTQNADFVILFPGIISAEALRAAKQLKLIQLVSAGFDTLDVALCKELEIPVSNNGGTNSTDVAEHTLTLILAWYRQLGLMDRNVRSERWGAIDSGASTYTIHGKTVGLVGLGNIGRKVAVLLNAFGANVLYTDAVPVSSDVEDDLGVTRVTLDELLAQSDVVSLHVPLNNQTRGMMGGAQFAKMKPSALLVNTCRGPVVDEAALIQALQKGQIAGAALDVLAQEPPAPDNPLLTMENVLLTPHIAGVTRDTWARRGAFIFANLQRVWRGEAPQAVIA
jgi:glyoxylate reductase/D-3-phosphoglycerate dehydrogenase